MKRKLTITIDIDTNRETRKHGLDTYERDYGVVATNLEEV